MEEHVGESISALMILSFDEWKKMYDHFPRMLLQAYSDNLYVTISIGREYPRESLSDINKKYRYETRFSFVTFRYDVRNTIPDSDDMSAEEFKTAFDEYILDAYESRLSMEQDEKAEGYQIDENYVDPDYWKYAK